MERGQAMQATAAHRVGAGSAEAPDAWKEQPFEWTFSIEVEGLGEAVPAKFTDALAAALQKYFGKWSELPDPGEPEQKAGSWLIPFRMVLETPESKLVTLGMDANDLFCLNKDTNLCKNGPAFLKEFLEEVCDEMGLAVCGKGQPQLPMKAHLTMAETVKFELTIAPLPKHLATKVEAFTHLSLQEWAEQLTPKVQTMISQEAYVAKDMVRVSDVSTDGTKMSMTVELSILAPTSRQPIVDAVLKKVPHHRDWVVDYLGMAAEEEKIGDIKVAIRPMDA